MHGIVTDLQEEGAAGRIAGMEGERQPLVPKDVHGLCRCQPHRPADKTGCFDREGGQEVPASGLQWRSEEGLLGPATRFDRPPRAHSFVGDDQIRLRPGVESNEVQRLSLAAICLQPDGQVVVAAAHCSCNGRAGEVPVAVGAQGHELAAAHRRQVQLQPALDPGVES